MAEPTPCPAPCPDPAHFAHHLVEVMDWAVSRHLDPDLDPLRGHGTGEPIGLLAVLQRIEDARDSPQVSP